MDHRLLHRALPSMLVLTAALAQGAAWSAIYKCTDAKGRTITADRPIPDCVDREQSELNASGTVVRKIEPTYSAQEQAERDARAREAAMQNAAQAEERRRMRALLARHPNAAAHDRARKETIAQIDAVSQGARKRLEELAQDRAKIDSEMEFYKKDPSKAPASLRRRLDDNTQNAALQSRFVADQEVEKRRVNARFDDERKQLEPLWAGAGR